MIFRSVCITYTGTLVILLVVAFPAVTEILVTASEVQLWVSAPGTAVVDFEIQPEPPADSMQRELCTDADGFAQVTLRGLLPGRHYRYRL